MAITTIRWVTPGRQKIAVHERCWLLMCCLCFLLEVQAVRQKPAPGTCVAALGASNAG